MTLTVVNAYNQRGWDAYDHLLGDDISAMVGRSYANLGALKRAARKLSESYPTVDYTDGVRLYRYDGSPTDIPGRYVRVISDMGEYEGA